MITRLSCLQGTTGSTKRNTIVYLLIAIATAASTLGGQFSYQPWNSDEDCGVSAVFTYTAAVNLSNDTTPLDVNGVPFPNTNILNSSGTGYAISGFGTVYPSDDANNVYGYSRKLGLRFHYGGNPGVITFSGLSSGTVYRATLFSVAWDTAPSTRYITFSCGSDSLYVNQSVYGNNNGIRIDYEYTADETGAISISATPDSSSNSFHLYALCNCEVYDDIYIDNASFEWPVVVGNGGIWEYCEAIGGWITTNGVQRIGLSTNAPPWGGGAAFPDGKQVLFLQNSASNTESLAQNIVNLTSGETYRVSYRYAGRYTHADPNIKVTFDGNIIQDTLYESNIGTGNPFILGTYEFTATNSTAGIMFENTRYGTNIDSAVLLDDVRIGLANANGWTVNPWTNDETSGIISNTPYTHAVNLGSGSSTTINGVNFKGSSGGDPSEDANGANYSTVFNSTHDDTGNTLISNGGGSATLAQYFCYHGGTGTLGDSEVITMNGLIPGLTYESTIYGIAWDNVPGTRLLAFNVNSSEEVTFNETTYGNNNGIRLSYRGTADTNGTITIQFRQLFDNSSFHTYGFANQAEPDTDIVLADAFAGHNGADNGSNISVHSPDHANVFVSGTYTETGLNSTYNTVVQGGTAKMGANAGAAILIHDRDGHLKPAVMRIQAELMTDTISGTDYANAHGVGLGFYNRDSYDGEQEASTGFTGLILAPNGDLYLCRNGTYAGDGSRVAYGGTFKTNKFYTLSYEVNANSATIANISLEGSTNDYSAIESASSGFAGTRTEMAGFQASSSTADTYGYIDSLVLTELVPGTPPPPGTFMLIR